MDTDDSEEDETTTYFSDEDDDEEDEEDEEDDGDESTRLSTDISFDSSLRRSAGAERRGIRPARSPNSNAEQQRRVVDLAAATTTTTTTTNYTEGEGEEYYTSFDEETRLGESTSFASRTTMTNNGQLHPLSHPAPALLQEAAVTGAAVPPTAAATTTVPPSHSPRVLDRVPGGAAAKIMLIGPKGSTSDSSAALIRKASTSESSSKAFVLQEDVLTSLEHELIRAKEEFRLGSPIKNRRTMMNQPEVAASDVSNSSNQTPSFMNRNEIFYSTAEAAVAALLSPDLTSSTPNKDSSTGFASFPSSPAHYEAKPVVSPNLLSKTAEQKVEDLKKKMLDPTTTLTGLLTAIATHADINDDELGVIVRRKNACGALQTLTAKPENRHGICWTVGVLPALTSVLQDALEIPNENPRVQKETEAAQARAIFALMNLSIPVKNRIAVFHSPGLVRAALMTIHETTGQPRQGCAAILASLAKSPENRLLLAQVPTLLAVVGKVLKPRPPRVEAPPKRVKKKYPWSDENSSDSSEENNTEGMSYDESWQTPRQEGGGSPRELTGYDETADSLLQGARQNLFAMLGHLVKEKDNAYHFARDIDFLTTLVDISGFQESPSHVLAIKIIAHLTRHRLNKVLAFKPKTVVPALIEATQSPNDDARLYACYALQNLSQEKSCRQELAIANHLIEVLCDRCRNGKHFEERLASISTLKNLCDEPANLIPMTNTADCITTLMQMADSSTDALIQYRACDALATLSHWLRKIATSGYSLDATEKGRPPMKGLFVPTLREVSWNQWT